MKVSRGSVLLSLCGFIALGALTSGCSSSADTSPSTNAQVASYCDTLCTRASACDRGVDKQTCAASCANQNAAVLPKLRRDVIGLITSCVDRKDCKDILTTNVAPACSDEAAASVAPSALATEACQSLETAQKKCGVAFDMAACLSRMKLYSEETLGQVRSCAAKACTDVDACVEATLGALGGYAGGGTGLDAGKTQPDAAADTTTLDGPAVHLDGNVIDTGEPPPDATTDAAAVDGPPVSADGTASRDAPPDGPSADSNTLPVDSGRDVGTIGSPRISLVHAAPNVGAVRFCVSSNPGASAIGSWDHQIPSIAIPFGGSASLTSDPAVGAVAGQLPNIPLYVFAVPASIDAAGTKKCSDFWDIDAKEPKDKGVVPLTTLPKGTFAMGTSHVVAAVGCAPGAASDAGTGKEECGDSYDNAKGNLRLLVVPVDATPAAADKIGFQFLHLSPQMNVTLKALSRGATDKVQPMILLAGDAGQVDVTVGSPVHYADQAGPSTTGLASTTHADDKVPTLKTSTYLQGRLGDANGPALITKISPSGLSLPVISKLTTGKDDPNADYFKTGKVYTVIAIGDPAIDVAPGNTGFRLIAVEN